MKILLVEDDPFKQVALVNEIKAALPLDTTKLVISASVTSCRRALENQWPFDLVLLDVSLPTFDVGPAESGGRPAGFGGKDILYFMESMDLICPVIVVTQFVEFGVDENKMDISTLERDLNDAYGTMLRGLIFFDSSREWAAKLRNALTSLAK